MEKINVEYKVYNFLELDNDIKQKVIDSYYDFEDYPFLENDILEELNQIDKYFEDIEIQYSLSCCQGDGLSFKGSFNLSKWLEDKYPNMKKSFKWALCEYAYQVFSTGNTGRYCFSHKNQIDYTENYGNGQTFPHVEKLMCKVLEGIEDYYIDTCSILEDYGYSIIHYRMTFGEYAEHAEANEYKYLVDGELFTE